MAIVIEIVLVLAIGALAFGFFNRNRRVGAQQELMERRVTAYMETIRREGKNADLAKMGDFELRDLLLSSARNLRVQNERRWYLLAGGALVVLLAAVVVGSQDGARGVGIAIVVGAIVLYGLNEFVGRRIREPLVAKGLDIERLRVE